MHYLWFTIDITYHLLQQLQRHFGLQDTLYYLLAVEDQHLIEATASAVPRQPGSHFHRLDLSAIPIQSFRYNWEFRKWKQCHLNFKKQLCIIQRTKCLIQEFINIKFPLRYSCRYILLQKIRKVSSCTRGSRSCH